MLILKLSIFSLMITVSLIGLIRHNLKLKAIKQEEEEKEHKKEEAKKICSFKIGDIVTVDTELTNQKTSEIYTFPSKGKITSINYDSKTVQIEFSDFINENAFWPQREKYAWKEIRYSVYKVYEREYT